MCIRDSTSSVYTNGNDDGVYRTVEYMESCRQGLIFTNLIDFDSMYGHRRDPEGYGRALEEFDAMLPAVIHRMKPEDLLIICADHGNDPVHAGWNHTREYVPLLVYGEMAVSYTHLAYAISKIGAVMIAFTPYEKQDRMEELVRRSEISTFILYRGAKVHENIEMLVDDMYPEIKTQKYGELSLEKAPLLKRVTVSYTHLDVYKRQRYDTGKSL